MDLTGLGSVADAAKTIVNKFLPDKMGDGEKAKAELELQALLADRDKAVLEAKKTVMVAELNQSDVYTKRARPTIVYSGLFFIFLVHVVFPIMSYVFGGQPHVVDLPEQFWWAWGGLCSVYAVGRTAEKNGAAGKVVSTITGNKGGA